jgi:hypothetical protein
LEETLAALKRARTPEAGSGVLRLLVAQRLVDTAGLPSVDRQGASTSRSYSRGVGGSEARRRIARLPSSGIGPVERVGCINPAA